MAHAVSISAGHSTDFLKFALDNLLNLSLHIFSHDAQNVKYKFFENAGYCIKSK